MADDKLEQLRSLSGRNAGCASLHILLKKNHDEDGVQYKTIPRNDMGFNRVGCLSKTIYPSRYGGGNDMAAITQENKAKCRDSCRLQFNKTKHQRSENIHVYLEDNAAISKRFFYYRLEETPPSVERVSCVACFHMKNLYTRHRPFRLLFAFLFVFIKRGTRPL